MSEMQKEVEARRNEERRIQNVTLGQGAIDELCKGIVERNRLLAEYRVSQGHKFCLSFPPSKDKNYPGLERRCDACKAADSLKAAK